MTVCNLTAGTVVPKCKQSAYTNTRTVRFQIDHHVRDDPSACGNQLPLTNLYPIFGPNMCSADCKVVKQHIFVCISASREIGRHNRIIINNNNTNNNNNNTKNICNAARYAHCTNCKSSHVTHFLSTGY